MLEDKERERYSLLHKTIKTSSNHFEQKQNYFTQALATYFFFPCYSTHSFKHLICFVFCIFCFTMTPSKFFIFHDSAAPTNVKINKTNIFKPIPPQCNNTFDRSQQIYAKYLKLKSFPPRTPFQNSLTVLKETNFKPGSEQFVFKGQQYFRKEKFSISFVPNSGVYSTYQSNNHSLVVKTEMKSFELLKSKFMHENHFASQILFLGPNYMITENFGKPIDKQNLSKHEITCVHFIILKIMKAIHKEQKIYHCNLYPQQIFMDKNFKITIIDWDMSDFVPGAPYLKCHFPQTLF